MVKEQYQKLRTALIKAKCRDIANKFLRTPSDQSVSDIVLLQIAQSIAGRPKWIVNQVGKYLGVPEANIDKHVTSSWYSPNRHSTADALQFSQILEKRYSGTTTE